MTLAEGRKDRSGNRTENPETDTTQTQTVDFFKRHKSNSMKERQICQKGTFHLKIKTYKKKSCVQNRSSI